MSLEEETKKAIEFVEKVETCSTCAHCVNHENLYVDRMWDDYCELSSVCHFKIGDKSRSTCSRHTPKSK